jgi:hypothetical protein
MNTWNAHVFRPSDRDVKFIQKPHGIFGRYNQPPVGWSDRDTVDRMLKTRGLTLEDAWSMTSQKSSAFTTR